MKQSILSLKKGFLLIELMCSVVLLMIISLILAQSHHLICMLQQDGLKRLIAVSATQNYIESWLISQQQTFQTSTQSAIIAPNTSFKDGFQRFYDTITITGEIVPMEQSGFSLLKVTTAWLSSEGNPVFFELYAGRSHTDSMR